MIDLFLSDFISDDEDDVGGTLRGGGLTWHEIGETLGWSILSRGYLSLTKRKIVNKIWSFCFMCWDWLARFALILTRFRFHPCPRCHGLYFKVNPSLKKILKILFLDWFVWSFFLSPFFTNTLWFWLESPKPSNWCHQIIMNHNAFYGSPTSWFGRHIVGIYSSGRCHRNWVLTIRFGRGN